MRTEITTLEIAEYYKISHADILRRVRSLIASDIEYPHMFTEIVYKNTRGRTYSRGRTYPAFKMGVEGFSVLSEYRSFQGVKKAIILSEFGEQVVVVGKKRTRHEDAFFQMLCEFLPHLRVVRQFPIAGYRVDFYIEKAGLFIEFDEEQHFSKKAQDEDYLRWTEINDHIGRRDGKSVPLIRVNKGCEIYGLSLIMSFLALNSPDGADAAKIAVVNDASKGADLINSTSYL